MSKGKRLFALTWLITISVAMGVVAATFLWKIKWKVAPLVGFFVGYILGAFGHSELMHFFAEVFGIK